DGLLVRRLAVLQHLSGELPPRVKGRSVQSIDLSDPDQPELGLPTPSRNANNPPRSAAASGRD
ncbi:MAG: cell division protein FtsQ, partial [Cyanobacteriota bacterium]